VAAAQAAADTQVAVVVAVYCIIHHLLLLPVLHILLL
jgi:hypothetical protein